LIRLAWRHDDPGHRAGLAWATRGRHFEWMALSAVVAGY
jgi:hypothetical protein